MELDVILDCKTYSVLDWLDVEGRRIPVIVFGRKPACWHCGEIGHLSSLPGEEGPDLKPEFSHLSWRMTKRRLP